LYKTLFINQKQKNTTMKQKFEVMPINSFVLRQVLSPLPQNTTSTATNNNKSNNDITYNWKQSNNSGFCRIVGLDCMTTNPAH
jgi:hypothetical protein